jgi:hypothetical protein
MSRRSFLETNRLVLMLVMSTVLVLAPIATMTITSPAFAATGDTTILIKAKVTAVDDPSNLLGGTIHKGSKITGSYTYNKNTPDSNTFPEVGDYMHTTSPYGITLSSKGLTFQTDPNDVQFLVELVNDYNGLDNYLLRSYNNLPLPNGVSVDHIAWQLDDPTMTALSSASLIDAPVPPVLKKWEDPFGLTIEGTGPNGDTFFIRAHVTHVTS